VIGVALALARRLPLAIRAQLAREWAEDEFHTPCGAVVTLRGRRMAILGLGSVGSEVAAMATGIGMRVSAVCRRERPPTSGIDELVPLDQLCPLLAKSDIVVTCLALTRETRQIISRRAVAAMRHGAFLINVGRGELLDDAAVLDGLQSGQIGGAALDVFAREPLDQASPYWGLPNVIVTPHAAGALDDYWTPLVSLFAENVRRFEKGELLLNVVDKRAGY
jgi:D-2-hydroxyacid dehydrogenase (NADP+)